MKISGFSFVKNATKLYFPLKESIGSILPLVDEFVIAMGDNDEDDRTREVIEEIGSDKIRVIDSPWDLKTFYQNTEYARQTDFAKEACSGDWLFYLQTDEVIHEKDYDEIKEACKKYLADTRVEGFLFNYKHFWGDFNHYHVNHRWYPKEIRIIRNLPEIHSWRDAQSFRYFDRFERKPEYYLSKEGTRKLNVVPLDAEVFHYGWVRPPRLMSVKTKKMKESYLSKKVDDVPTSWDYGPLNKLETFREAHPKIMKDWISQMDWKDQLYMSEEEAPKNRVIHKHEKLKYTILTYLEQKLFGGNQLGGFKNYNIIEP